MGKLVIYALGGLVGAFVGAAPAAFVWVQDPARGTALMLYGALLGGLLGLAWAYRRMSGGPRRVSSPREEEGRGRIRATIERQRRQHG